MKNPKFFGEKCMTNEQFERFKEKASDTKYLSKNLPKLFQTYQDQLEEVDKDLIPVFSQALLNLFDFCIQKEYSYKQSTTIIEIFVFIFEKSF